MKILRFFTSVYFGLFFAAVALSLLVWYLGPLIGTEQSRPLAGLTPRLLIVGFFILLFGGIGLTIFLLRRRREKEMTEEIAESVDMGDDVATGDTLFEVTDVFGGAKTEVTAESGGVFWRSRRLPQVATGEYVCSVGTDVDEY